MYYICKLTIIVFTHYYCVLLLDSFGIMLIVIIMTSSVSTSVDIWNTE
jgi:hypothetical protein